MTFSLLLIFGLAPSIVWLLFYLRKDTHPEPNAMILKVFFWGMVAAIPAIAIELGILFGLSKINFPQQILLFLYVFGGVALVEEGLKYLVVRWKVLHNPAFDEPIDFILYMIIAALGFAALENMIILLGITHAWTFSQVAALTGLRFVGATFLHALASGAFGYFVLLSFSDPSKKYLYFFSGLGISTLLHGLFNLSIIEVEGIAKFALPLLIVLGLAFFVSFGFRKFKK